MAIQTSIKRSFLYWNLVYLVLCGGLGAWGAYDYWVTIPAQEAAVKEYTALTAEQSELDGRAEFFEIQKKLRAGTADQQEKATFEKIRSASGGNPLPLTDEDVARYEAINNILTVDFENTPPQAPASYDGWVNFYVYFIGCGVLGAPWFLWKLVSRRGLSWTLEDDGSLVTPDGTYESDRVIDIDMALWMRKSIARVEIEGVDDPVLLDDYENQDAYLIVGALAHKFYPDEWTEEAKLVKSTDDDAGSANSEDQDPDSEPDSEADSEVDREADG
ncbi:MAG: hypothetical protein CMJ34_07020 [Phycisphaerae bacterium]|nr:hypothetical protein [Phycisphaerae bacterium]